MNPPEHLVGHMRGVSGNLAVIGLLQDVLESQAKPCVEPLPRDIDEARYEPLERIAPHKQRNPLPFLQMQDAHADLVEIILTDLQQLIARISLKDMGQRLAIMAGGREAGPGENVLHLAPQQRDLPGAAAVGGGGQQPDEEPFANNAFRSHQST